MSVLDVQPFVPCSRSRRCLRRDKHEGDCGRVRAVLRDIWRKQSNHLAAKILDVLGHPQPYEGPRHGE